MTNITRSQDARALRYKHRNHLHSYSTLKRLRTCGLFGVGSHVGLRLGGTAARPIAGVAGVETCGSVWACPVCSSRIAAHRNTELNKVNTAWRARGGSILFATFTMRHQYEDSLQSLWDGLSASWRRLVSGKGYLDLKAEYGIEGYVRVVEVTHGDNGWHVHTHTAIYLKDELTDFDLSQLQQRLYARWVTALDKDGFTASQAHGVDVIRTLEGSGLGAYMTKFALTHSSLVQEMTNGHNKVAKKTNRVPFRILADIVENGDTADMALWETWETVSRGRRMMTWSVGLREMAKLSRELTDEEIVALDQLNGTTVLSVPSKSWASLMRNGHAADILSTLENHGVITTAYLLASHGVEPTIHVNPETWSLPVDERTSDENDSTTEGSTLLCV